MSTAVAETRAGSHTLRWGERTYVMGIINVTRDSFSGDGLLAGGRGPDEAVAAAVDLARRFVDEGADILDVGAESTRPRAVYGEHPEVGAATEARAAVPVVAALARELGEHVPISIDTSKGEVARQALAAGASIVNDVWAARRDPRTAEAAAETGAALVLMHNKERAEYPGGMMAEITAWLRDAVDGALAAGVQRGQLIVDPGIGFGKDSAMNLELLHRLGELRALGLPILVGPSRKRFIGELLDDAPPGDRLEGTAAAVSLAISAGADMVRVHDVRKMARVVRVADAITRLTPSFG
ncbi:MAG: dihydropteroate synthase [Candidatus Limnocylindria bacterium]